MSGSIKSSGEIATMREGGRILAKVLQYVARQLEPGVTTEELDRLAVAETRRLGGEPAFTGHEGYTKALCVSMNEAVVHGLPSSQRTIQAGDIVGLDYGVRYKGLITDSAVTVPVGVVSKDAQRLLTATREALYVGIDQMRAGNRVGDVSAAIERHLRAAGLGIVRELAGHGVGYALWEEPQVPNFGPAGRGPVLKPGMVLAIEPMAALGEPAIRVLDDGWTIVTRDGSLAAQFEHTVAVTSADPEILTEV